NANERRGDTGKFPRSRKFIVENQLSIDSIEKSWRLTSALPLAHPKGISGHIMAKTLLGSVAVRQRPGERATALAEWLENHD
ncbi:MAG TPA: hypothetical protein VF340_03885, partial [Methyloceanibacter sp.]